MEERSKRESNLPKEGASYEKGEKNGKVNNVLSSVDRPRMY